MTVDKSDPTPREPNDTTVRRPTNFRNVKAATEDQQRARDSLLAYQNGDCGPARPFGVILPYGFVCDMLAWMDEVTLLLRFNLNGGKDVKGDPVGPQLSLPEGWPDGDKSTPGDPPGMP